MIAWEIETTDTFGGEANYSWCNRETLELPEGLTERQTVLRLRKAAGLNGYPARTEPMQDGYVFRYPAGDCTVTFAVPRN